MKIAVGSLNPVKVQAVEEVLRDYQTFSAAEVVALAIASQVAEQPLSLGEMVSGATHRARGARSTAGASFGFGLESGLFEAPGIETGFFEACVCAIDDGRRISFGLSCGFEIPKRILSLMFEKGMDLAAACHASGLCSHANLGRQEGLIGLLTRGRVTRKEYTKQCITTALLQVENDHLYQAALREYEL